MLRLFSVVMAAVAFATLAAFPHFDGVFDDVAVPVESAEVQKIRADVAKGGQVVIPTGVHYFYAPLVIKQNNTMPISLVGSGAEVSALDFSKMPDKTQAAIRLDRQWGYRFQGFSVRGGGRNAGGVGIDVNTITPNANGSYGTCSGQSVWDHISIYGFTTGIRVGDRDKYIAASEMVYSNLKVVQCKTCIELNDFNTLNHLFFMLQIGECDFGLKTNGASSISVLCGSASAVKGVGFMFASCDKASVRDFRFEDSACGIAAGTTTTVTHLVAENCQFHQRQNLEAEKDIGYWSKSAVVVGGSCSAVFRSCNFDMTVSATPILWAKNGPDGMMTVSNCSAECTGDFIAYGQALTSANPGRLIIDNVARTKAGHIPNGWFKNVP